MYRTLWAPLFFLSLLLGPSAAWAQDHYSPFHCVASGPTVDYSAGSREGDDVAASAYGYARTIYCPIALDVDANWVHITVDVDTYTRNPIGERTHCTLYLSERETGAIIGSSSASTGLTKANKQELNLSVSNSYRTADDTPVLTLTCELTEGSKILSYFVEPLYTK